MLIEKLKGKIHRATVTQAELDYVGSITLDRLLCDASGICEYQKVLVADVDSGSRFETYVIFGESGSGVVCVNGAAAHLVEVGDKVIVMAFALLDEAEAKDSSSAPHVVFVDDENAIVRESRYEEHGQIA